jgi:hypothetical protein
MDGGLVLLKTAVVKTSTAISVAVFITHYLQSLIRKQGPLCGLQLL